MGSFDWAAWTAIKAVAEAIVRTKSTQYETVRDYLQGDEIIIDGFKGSRMNFRPWSGQLRQPLLLGTQTWVVDRVPLKGFLHPTNNMDTLGFDESASQCER